MDRKARSKALNIIMFILVIFIFASMIVAINVQKNRDDVVLIPTATSWLAERQCEGYADFFNMKYKVVNGRCFLKHPETGWFDFKRMFGE